MNNRLDQLHTWIETGLNIRDYTVMPASEDASFRRYFRLQYDSHSFIIMDAPPQHEDCLTYIDIAQRLGKAGVNVPVVIQKDLDQGFLLITDLGSTLYLHQLSEKNADRLYGDAIGALVQVQKNTDTNHLPPYDEVLLRKEMQLFPDWLLGRHLEISLSARQKSGLQKVFDFLVNSALSQPRTFVHRDYHSRNLMYCPQFNPGIVDFQDAVLGPLTYDLVSLLKDCYIKWPYDQIEKWLQEFFESMRIANSDYTQFLQWFDLMGVQRHLKASGIFARLYYRDNKAGFLKDIPRTLSYITDLGVKYPELESLVDLIETEMNPKLEEANRTCGQ